MNRGSAVGIRELKNGLSRCLGRVRTGERITVTDRGRPVAVISPAPATPSDARIDVMLREGAARWGGGKPAGAHRPPRIKGPSAARAVIEDRR